MNAPISITDLAEQPVHLVLRGVLEARSPISLGSGEATPFQDMTLVRDASGLPLIPGSSLAGVLRSHYAARTGSAEQAAHWFGQAERNAERASRVSISSASIHGSDDRPVSGLVDPAEIAGDPVLGLLSRDAPVLRDHVRIGEAGVADDAGKFDRALIPSGARFSFEIFLRASDAERSEARAFLSALAGIMTSPLFRLGGATRRGYGRAAIDLESSHLGEWDLTQESGRKAQLAYARSELGDRPEACGFQPIEQDVDTTVEAVVIRSKVSQLEGSFLRTGAGPAIPVRHAGEGQEARDPDASPLVEAAIVYEDGKGRIETGPDSGNSLRFVLPGSGIKGAIRHRTLFEWRRLTGTACDDDDARREWAQLFGAIADTVDGKATGQAGAVYVEDSVIECSRADLERHLVHLDHVVIDRFTQGVRDGLLFGETALFGTSFDIELAIDNRRTAGLDPSLKKAFCRAVMALLSGRLAVGANDGDGMGRLVAENGAAAEEVLTGWSSREQVGETAA